MTTPPRTEEERTKALGAAVAARVERARLRADLKAGRMSAVAVIDGAAKNPTWARLPVRWLLESLPGVGAVRAQRLLDRLQIARSRRIQGLGVRQRAELLAELARDER